MDLKDLLDCLQNIANLAACLTAAIAVYGYIAYRADKHRNKRKLERYLKCQKDAGSDKGQRSVTHIMARVGLTEAEIFEASRHSKHIARRIKTDANDQFAAALLFEYERNCNAG